MSVNRLTMGMHMSNASQTFKGSAAELKADRKRESKKLFSMRSALGAALLLTALLWWLPVFGQMIAGYVGGRKSGSVGKGLLVSASAVGVYVAAVFVLSYLEFSIADAQGSLISALAGSYPAVGEFTDSIFGYLQGLFDTFGTLGSELATISLITVMFGIVGGIVSGQVAKEMAHRAPVMESAPRSARSLEAMNSGRSMGFGSFDDYVQMNGTQSNRLDPSVSGSASTRKVVPAQEPAEHERKESPLSSVLQMSDRKPAAERPVTKDDFEYI